MDLEEAGDEAVEIIAEDGAEDIVTLGLATRIAETDTEMTGDITRTGRGIATTRTGGEMIGIMRVAVGVGPVVEDTLRREGIQRIGGMTHTHLRPHTASDPGGKTEFFTKCINKDNVQIQVSQSL